MRKLGRKSPPVSRPPIPPIALVQRIGRLAGFFLSSYQKLGPIFQIEKPTGAGAVVMSGPAAIEFLDNEGRDFWDEEDFRRDQNRELGSNCPLVSLHGAEHRVSRHLQRRAYGRQAVASHFDELVDCVRTCASSHRSGDCVNARDFFVSIVARQLGVAFLDHSMEGYIEDLCLFLDTVASVTLAGRAPKRLLESEAYQTARERTMRLGDEIVKSNRVQLQRRPGNVANALLGAEQSLLTPSRHADLRSGALGPFVAGLDQVANSCAFMCFALFTNEGVRNRVQKEIVEVCNGGPLEYRSLGKLKLLRGAVLETLRLYPTAPALKGKVSKSFEFIGYGVEVDTTLIVGTCVSHFLPELYPDEFRFDPDRARPERDEYGKRGAFGAYGIGRHRCLGSLAAQDLMMLTMATLLHDSPLELDPPDYLLTFGGTPTPVPEGLRLRWA